MQLVDAASVHGGITRSAALSLLQRHDRRAITAIWLRTAAHRPLYNAPHRVNDAL
jgi:hypothetical protein